jgi:hypothetical protein
MIEIMISRMRLMMSNCSNFNYSILLFTFYFNLRFFLKYLYFSYFAALTKLGYFAAKVYFFREKSSVLKFYFSIN